jgi:hypothetical protein
MDKELDDILKQAGTAPHPVDPALLNRIGASIQPDLRPVRPVPPSWALTLGLTLVCTAVALLGATRAGFYGFHKLSVLDRALIFPLLGVFICFTAASSVAEFIPGSRRTVPPLALLGMGAVALLAVFAFVFRDYQTEHFLSQGIVCLTVGLFHAVPTAIVIWFLLRRGFAVNPVTAGAVAGTLAGLAGVTMLELHCPNFEFFHVMLWHTAVVLVSGAAGAWLGRFVPSRP